MFANHPTKLLGQFVGNVDDLILADARQGLLFVGIEVTRLTDE
ncbi:MAG: hypothetical protein U0822_04670 [Anaerolineae bacterium]